MTTNDELIKRVSEELVNVQKERILDALNSFSPHQFSPGAHELVKAANKILFSNREMVPQMVSSFLVESINAQMPDKTERYHKTLRFLGQGKNFFQSMVTQLLLGALPFLHDGIELEERDAKGERVRVSVYSIRDQALEFLDDLSSLEVYVARYTGGVVDAYKVAQAKANPLEYREAIDLETFVRDPKVQLYGLIRMLAPYAGILTSDSLIQEPDRLRERYEEFTKRFITGPDGTLPGEWSYIANKPFDLVLTTAKALIHIAGNEKHWSFVLRLLFQSKNPFEDIDQQLAKYHNMGEEVRLGMEYAGERIYKTLEDSMMLWKQVLNITGHDMVDEQWTVIETLGANKSMQRDIVKRYFM